jgi:hypothetical protein
MGEDLARHVPVKNVQIAPLNWSARSCAAELFSQIGLRNQNVAVGSCRWNGLNAAAFESIRLFICAYN